jgi:hypothetical protein
MLTKGHTQRESAVLGEAFKGQTEVLPPFEDDAIAERKSAVFVRGNAELVSACSTLALGVSPMSNFCKKQVEDSANALVQMLLW